MKEQQTAPLTTEELTEKYHKLRRTFILATVISIFGTIVMLPSVLFFKIPYALAGALVLLTGESMRYRIKKEMRALAPWILASGVLNETFEDVRYQPSGCLSRETLLKSGLPLPEFDAVQGSALVSAAYQGTSFEFFRGTACAAASAFRFRRSFPPKPRRTRSSCFRTQPPRRSAGSASCWAAGTSPSQRRIPSACASHRNGSCWLPTAASRTLPSSVGALPRKWARSRS